MDEAVHRVDEDEAVAPGRVAAAVDLGARVRALPAGAAPPDGHGERSRSQVLLKAVTIQERRYRSTVNFGLVVQVSPGC